MFELQEPFFAAFSRCSVPDHEKGLVEWTEERS
jgi:hypothetical protein